jgi:two-component system, OmpR family, response regulator ResD
MTAKHILVVDDEPTILEVVELYLRREGYEVSTARSGVEALEQVARERPDLMVLDLMLPELGGLEVCRQLHAAPGAPPIIMLTARGEETDRVVGLELGADDYITKPFSPRELVARVKAVLRRARAEQAPQPGDDSLLRTGDLLIRVASRAVELAGQPVALTAREFDLLLFLARHPGQVFRREQLLDQVWGFSFASDASTVTVHIRRLREKIEHDPTSPRYLHTVWGVGYKFDPAQAR